MNYMLEELIDVAGFQEMLDRLNGTLLFSTAIVDRDGKILTASGWQDICERFHRAKPLTEEQCRLSSLSVFNHVRDRDSSVTFSCPMGLIDCATPVIIDGKYFGAVFMGQFFHEEPDVDAFRNQAHKYGFDEDDYLDALSRVPVITMDQFERNLTVIRILAKIITEAGLKRMKQKESEYRFRTIFDSVSDAIFIHNPETGAILDVNATMRAMYGFSGDEVRLLTLETICSGVAPYTYDDALVRIRRAAAGEDQIFEWHARRKDGGLFWVEVSMRKAFITDEEIVLALARDITKRKQAEEALRESERRFRMIADNVNDMIWTMDISGTITYVSPSTERHTGYSAEEAMRLTLEEILTPSSAAIARERLADAVSRILAGQRLAPESIELEERRKDGSVFKIEASVSAVYGDFGEFIGFLGVSRDITEREYLRDELLKAQKLESLGILAGGIAHDFNNVLTGILGNISLARTFLEDAHLSNRFLRKGEQAIRSAASLADRFLTFAKGGDPVKRPVSIGHLVRESVSLMLRGTNVQCTVVVPDSTHVIAADEGQISQAFNNIILNAVQSMPGGGTLTVHAENFDTATGNISGLGPGEYVRITFLDEGCGISGEDRKKVFAPYSTTKPNGTGLGLTSTYSIINRHGGHIDIESTVGKGTKLIIYLPSLGEPFLEHCSEKKSSVSVSRREGTILVMDDEEIIRTLAAEMLEYLGYRVVTCSDGAEAVTLYKEAKESGKPFFAVILDLSKSGGLCARETVHSIRAIDSHARLIATIGYLHDPIMAEYSKCGFRSFVVKPYDADDIARVLNSLEIPRSMVRYPHYVDSVQ